MSKIDERLQAYIQRIWQPDGVSDSPVSVTLGQVPRDHVVAEQYAVLPHLRRPRYLVPLGSRAAASASFRTYRASRSHASRMLRGALGAAYATGIAQRVVPGQLTVSVDRRFPRSRWSEVLVMEHLAAELGHVDIHALVAVRRINPGSKPTLQLFDGAGRPVGYAKLGTTAPTRKLVRREAAAMAALEGKLDSVIVPHLLFAGDWGSSALAVGAPLPTGIQLWTRGAEATASAIRQVAQSGRTSYGPLAGSAYVSRMRAELAAIPAPSDVAPVLKAWLTRLERSPHRLEFGRMHGDWIPNNLGRLDSRIAVWDWEHSTDEAPVGFDLLHWYFHPALDQQGLAAAVTAVDAAQPKLALVEVPAGARRLVASTYLLDIFVRWTKLAAGGVAWNPKWYPALIDVARTRDCEN